MASGQGRCQTGLGWKRRKGRKRTLIPLRSRRVTSLLSLDHLFQNLETMQCKPWGCYCCRGLCLISTTSLRQHQSTDTDLAIPPGIGLAPPSQMQLKTASCRLLLPAPSSCAPRDSVPRRASRTLFRPHKCTPPAVPAFWEQSSFMTD